MRTAKPVMERLMAKTYVPIDEHGNIDNTQCWVWQGAKNNAGYGMIRQDSDRGMRQVTAVVAEHTGIWLPNLEVQHTCLNTTCVNPAHLVMGTSKQRYNRIIKKRGHWLINTRWENKETMIKQCPDCKERSYITWFSRQHKHCKKD